MSIQGVIDAATQPSAFPTSPFLAQASATIAKRQLQNDTLVDEENLLDEWKRILPKNWAYDSDTANSRDPIRITQAERLHCVSDQVPIRVADGDSWNILSRCSSIGIASPVSLRCRRQTPRSGRDIWICAERPCSAL